MLFQANQGELLKSTQCWNTSGILPGRTDPGSWRLPTRVLRWSAIAKERHFFRVLTADPTVGGRFSVLADFGLLPMAWMGMDLTHVLDFASTMMKRCSSDVSVAENPGLVLGAVLGEAALTGRDKLTLIADQPLTAFGSWLEQLIAESSGKDGKGIVVIDGEDC